MKRNIGVMPMDGLIFLMKRLIGDLPEFAGEFRLTGYGETLLINDLAERIAVIKSYFPSNSIEVTSTFGVKYMSLRELEGLISAGLNEVYVSCYGFNENSYKNVHGIDRFEMALHNIKLLLTLREKYKFNLHLKYPDFNAFPDQHVDRDTLKKEMQELFGYSKNILYEPIKLFNRGGGKQFNKYPLSRHRHPCSVVWGYRARKLAVNWNLDVSPCCLIVDNDVILGNLYENTLDEIFTAATYVDFYKKHWALDIIDFPTCHYCDLPNDSSSTNEISRLHQDRLRSIVGTSWQTKGEIIDMSSVSNAPKNIFGWVDSIKKDFLEHLTIRLWAADLEDGAPLSKIRVLIDGRNTRIISAKCESRGDVMDANKRFDWKYSGLVLTVPNPGKCEEVKVIAENSRGEALVLHGAARPE
jgi:hypothetical protein